MAEHLEGKTKYGRKKLDEHELTAQTSSKNFEGRQGTKFGRRKGAIETPAAPTDETTKEKPKVRALASVPTLAGALAKKPLLLDRMIEAELAAEKPRKTALQLFLDTELERKKPKTRDAVVERLTTAIAGLGKKAE